MNPDVRDTPRARREDTPSCIRGGFPTTRPLRSRTRARLVPGRAGEPCWSLGRHTVYGKRADRAPHRVCPQTDVYVPRGGTRSSVFAPRGKCYCPRGRLARPSVLVEICSGRSEQRATSARCRSAFFLASHAHPSLARSVLLDPELIPGNGNPNSDTCPSHPRYPPKPKHRQDGERGGGGIRFALRAPKHGHELELKLCRREAHGGPGPRMSPTSSHGSLPPGAAGLNCRSLEREVRTPRWL